MNHPMQPATKGLPGEYYQIATSIDPQLLRLLGDWTSRHAGLPPGAP